LIADVFAAASDLEQSESWNSATEHEVAAEPEAQIAIPEGIDDAEAFIMEGRVAVEAANFEFDAAQVLGKRKADRLRADAERHAKKMRAKQLAEVELFDEQGYARRGFRRAGDPDFFRTRRGNTSRAPSMHVDEFMLLSGIERMGASGDINEEPAPEATAVPLAISDAALALPAPVAPAQAPPPEPQRNGVISAPPQPAGTPAPTQPPASLAAEMSAFAREHPDLLSLLGNPAALAGDPTKAAALKESLQRYPSLLKQIGL